MTPVPFTDGRGHEGWLSDRFFTLGKEITNTRKEKKCQAEVRWREYGYPAPNNMAKWRSNKKNPLSREGAAGRDTPARPA
ncbi:MAG: hypothetical protein ACYDBT_08890 [Desulfobulbaceae bacterium]